MSCLPRYEELLNPAAVWKDATGFSKRSVTVAPVDSVV